MELVIPRRGWSHLIQTPQFKSLYSGGATILEGWKHKTRPLNLNPFSHKMWVSQENWDPKVSCLLKSTAASFLVLNQLPAAKEKERERDFLQVHEKTCNVRLFSWWYLTKKKQSCSKLFLLYFNYIPISHKMWVLQRRILFSVQSINQLAAAQERREREKFSFQRSPQENL